jgi:hypothetical protein
METVILAQITQLFGAVVIVNHIPSCTSAGSVLQLCKGSFKSNEPFRRRCAYKPISPYRTYFRVDYLPFQILDSNHIPSCTSAGTVI